MKSIILANGSIITPIGLGDKCIRGKRREIIKWSDFDLNCNYDCVDIKNSK